MTTYNKKYQEQSVFAQIKFGKIDINTYKTPHWMGLVSVRETQTGYRVDFANNTYDTHNYTEYRIYIRRKDITKQQAINLASHSKKGGMCRIRARGCWVISNCWKMYEKEYLKNLRWLEPLREKHGRELTSLKTQDAIIKLLKLPDSFAASAFPKGLVD